MYRLLRAAIVTAVCMLTAAVLAAGDWTGPWSQEKTAAKVRCQETFDDYQLQAVCMKNEKTGYEQMQEDFGLPSDLVNAAKDRCADTFDSFAMQATCMENEKDGYDELQVELGVPEDVAAGIRERCGDMFDSFSMQATCLENEKEGYEEMENY